MEASAIVSSGFRLTTLEETSILLTSLILYTCLFLAGRCICSTKFPKSIWAPTGLLSVYLVFLIGSNIWEEFSILFPLITLICLAFFGMIKSRKTIKIDLEQFLMSLLFVFPLCWLATVNNNPFWDDFTNWLPPARYLSQYGHLPTFENPDLIRSTQNYPFARALFHSWVSTVTSSFSLNVQGILNILFASSFLLWADDLSKLLKGSKNVSDDRKRSLIFMGVLSGLLIVWVLTLNTRMVITSYADPTFSIFIANIFIYLSITYYQNNSFKYGNFDPIVMVLFMLPVIIKDTGIIFSVLIFGAFWFVNVPSFGTGMNVGLQRYIKLTFYQLLHLAPAFLLMFIWWIYCSTHNLSAPLSIKPMDSWNFSTIPLTLDAIWGQLLGRPYLLLGALAISWLMIFKRKRKYKNLGNEIFLRVSLVFSIIMIAFHFVCYIAVFSEAEAARAASFSRYIAPCGLIIWIGIMMFWITSKTHSDLRSSSWVGGILASVFLSATIFFAERIVVPGTQAPLKKAAKFIDNNFNNKGSILIIDFLTSGIDSVSIKFYLSSSVSAKTSYMAWRPNGVSYNDLEKMVNDFDNIYVHSAGHAERTMIAKILNKKSKAK